MHYLQIIPAQQISLLGGDDPRPYEEQVANPEKGDKVLPLTKTQTRVKGAGQSELWRLIRLWNGPSSVPHSWPFNLIATAFEHL